MPDLVNFSPPFAIHGKYVGPGHTGAPRLGDSDFSTEPIDRLDAAARVHDWQYATQPNNRASADAVLSSAAWDAARDSSLPLLTRAKALVVAGGMRGMSLIGSSNGEQLEYPQTARNHRAFRVREPRALVPAANNQPRHAVVGGKFQRPNRAPAVVRGAIAHPSRRAALQSGSHGEITGTDDLSAPRRNPPRAAAAAAGTRKPKSAPSVAVVQELISALVKQGGGRATAQRSRRNVRAPPAPARGTTFPTGTPIVSQTANTIESIRIRNFKVRLQDLITPPTIIANGQVLFSFSIDRLLFSRTALKPIYQLFNKWTNDKITFEIVPALPTNTAGNVQSVTDTDAADVQVVGTVLDDAFYSGHGRKMLEHSAFGAPWQVVLPANRRRLFTDLPRQTSATTAPVEVRESSAGVITISSSTGFNSTSTNIGSLWVVFNGSFSVSDYSEDDAVISMVKVSSVNGGTITSSAATSWDLVKLFNSALSTLNPNYAEYTYDRFFFDGTSFYLPLGVYYFKFFVGHSSNPGNISGFGISVSGSPTYSTDLQVISSTSNANIPEFTVTPSTPTAQVGSVQFGGVIRVTKPDASIGPYFKFKPVYTSANSVNAVTLQIVVYRLPSTLSEPFTAQFPLGNSGQSVELACTPNTSPCVPVVCPPPATPHLLMSRGEYDEWRAYQATKGSAVTVDVSRSGKDEAKAGWFGGK